MEYAAVEHTENGQLLARAIYVLGSINAENLSAEVSRLEQTYSLCLPTEPSESQEDTGADILRSVTPETGDLHGDRAE